MARPRHGGGSGIWWTAGILVLAAILLLWWLGRESRRVDVPPPPVLGTPAAAPSPGDSGVAGPEITSEEKAELQRILRERAGRPGPTRGDR